MEYGKQINFDLDVKIFKHGISYFDRIKLFSSVSLHCVMHGIVLICVKVYC